MKALKHASVTESFRFCIITGKWRLFNLSISSTVVFPPLSGREAKCLKLKEKSMSTLSGISPV